MANRLPWQPGPNSAEAEIAYLGPAHSLDLYADGFRRAAESLLDVARNSDELRDSLVYPIVYNLRHAIELTLKKVIWSARRLVDEPGERGILTPPSISTYTTRTDPEGVARLIRKHYHWPGSAALIAAKSGLSERTVRAILAGKKPTPRSAERLWEFAYQQKLGFDEGEADHV